MATSIQEVRQRIANRTGSSYMGFEPQSTQPASQSSTPSTNEKISVVFRDEQGVSTLDNISKSDWEKWKAQEGYTEIAVSSTPITQSQKNVLIQKDIRAIPLEGGGTTYASHAATKGMDEREVLDSLHAQQVAKNEAMIREGVWIGPDDQLHLSSSIPYGLSADEAAKRGFKKLSPSQIQLQSTAEGVEISAQIAQKKPKISSQIAQKQRANLLSGSPALDIPAKDAPLIARGIPASIQADLDRKERERLAALGKQTIQSAWEGKPRDPSQSRISYGIDQAFGKVAAAGYSTAGVVNWDFMSSLIKPVFKPDVAKTHSEKTSLTPHALDMRQDFYVHSGQLAERGVKSKESGQSLARGLAGEAKYQALETPFSLLPTYAGGKVAGAAIASVSAPLATAAASKSFAVSTISKASLKGGKLAGLGLTVIGASLEVRKIELADRKAPVVMESAMNVFAFMKGFQSGAHLVKPKKQEAPVSEPKPPAKTAAKPQKILAQEKLGITKKEPTRSEITSAYRKMTKKYHPDLNPQVDRAKIQEINEAYSYLTGKSGSSGGGSFAPPPPPPPPPAVKPIIPPPVTPIPPVKPVIPITPVKPVLPRHTMQMVRRPDKAFNPLKAVKPEAKSLRIRKQAQNSIDVALSPIRALRIYQAKPFRLRESRISKKPIAPLKKPPTLLRVPTKIPSTIKPLSTKRFPLQTTKRYPPDVSKRPPISKPPTQISPRIIRTRPSKPKKPGVKKPAIPGLPIGSEMGFAMEGFGFLGGQKKTGRGAIRREFLSISDLLGGGRQISSKKTSGKPAQKPSASFSFLSIPSNRKKGK